MSRVGLLIGLAVSIALHAWLLSRPRPAAAPPAPPDPDAAAKIIPVVEPAAAPAHIPTPAPTPPPAPAPAPAPEPARRPPEPAVAPASDEAGAPVDLAPAPETLPLAPDRRGDFAGTRDGHAGPTLRIDWGSADHAAAVREAAGMRIVIVGAAPANPSITGLVEPADGGWRRAAYLPAAGAARFSNRLRIVDDVPAFAAICADVGLGPRERLAVLVPVAVEQLLHRARLRASARRGLDPGRLRSLGGRFTLDGGRLAFDLTHVELRPDPPVVRPPEP